MFDIIVVSLIAAPLYLTNSMALLFGGKGRIDFGKNFFDGKPILGKGKTFSGLAGGIALGSLLVLAIVTAFPNANDFIPNYLVYGVLLCIGTMAGDIVASFLKRRTGMEQGREVLLLDQLDFVVGGLAVGSFLFLPTVWEFLFLAAFTLAVHKISNFLAFKIKVKRVPW